jgi:uncharacterized protein
MLFSTLLMAGIALILVAIGVARGDGSPVVGAKTALRLALRVLPLLVFAFLATGMISALVPKEVLAKMVGPDSGWRGILLATLAGGVAPGGPVVQAGLAAGFFHAGAAIGPLVAFMVAGMLWGFELFPLEAGMLGWKVMLVRFGSTFFVPPLAGWIAQTVFGRFFH